MARSKRWKRVEKEPEYSGERRPGGRLCRLGELTARNLYPRRSQMLIERDLSVATTADAVRRVVDCNSDNLPRLRIRGFETSSRWLRRKNQSVLELDKV